MSRENKKEARSVFPIFTLILSVSFLCVIAALCLLFSAKLNEPSDPEPKTVTLTEYVYIKEEDNTDDSVSAGQDEVQQEKFLVKEYYDKIGVFSLSDGKVRYVIERYTKTLPERDRALLKEGFVVNGINGIYSIIEDYTG